MFFGLIGNQRWPPLKEKFNIGSYEENISKLFQSETNEIFESKLCWNVPLMIFYIMCFCVDKKSEMASINRHKFSIGPDGGEKYVFSESQNLFEAKTNMNGH